MVSRIESQDLLVNLGHFPKGTLFLVCVLFTMGRKTVRHELIKLFFNKFISITAFRKRKAGLLKKPSKLTTLCGDISCTIVYRSYDLSQIFGLLHKKDLT